MNLDEEILKAEFFYKAASESYSLINGTNEKLDGKIRDMVGIISAIVPITIGLVYFVLDTLSTRIRLLTIPPLLLIYLTVLSLIFFASALILAVAGTFPQDFEFIDPSKLIENYKDESRIVILQRASATLASTVTANNKVCDRKAEVLKKKPSY